MDLISMSKLQQIQQQQIFTTTNTTMVTAQHTVA